MAEVGVALLSAFLGVLFDKMASREVVDFLQGRKLTQGLLRKLKIAMLSVNTVLEDAEERQHTKPIVKEWIYELKDALYDAEDVLDEIATEALRCKLDAEFQTTARKVRNSLSTLNRSVHEGEPNIREVLDRLEDLAKQKDFMGLKNEVGGKQSERFPSTSFVDGSGVLGREKDKEKIIEFLLSDDTLMENEMYVVGIIGLGGLGKTTLARVIYNDPRVEEHFNGFKAWCFVSDEFVESNIMKSIINAAAGNSSANDIEEPEMLDHTLVKTLKGKKFLVVLDDVRSKEPAQRDFLRELLKHGTRGSKVIITTREKDIAEAMHAVFIHPLEELKHEFCWLLFQKHAFPDRSSHVDPKLKKIGVQIVRRCGGLPLAVKAIGDLLWSETDVKKWKKILNNNLWDLEEAGITPALSLSYKYLPSHLKRCFTYCSIFPKGYNFAKDQVILLWMAEGFLQTSKSETMEEVGDCYFRALVSRSLFQKSRDSNSKFFMHDLVHDLAKFESRQFSFTLEVDNSYEITKMTRHMSYFCRSLDDSKKIDDEDLYRATQLRTFLALDSKPWNRKMKLSGLRRLRVLSLSHCKNIMELHDSFNKNKQLRYLDLSYTDIKRLPDSLCDLCNLQTLNLEFCKLLTALPRDLWKLNNLRHLDFAETDMIKRMPIRMGRLKGLQTLTKFIVGENSGPHIRELGELVNLRGKLHILELQNVESIEDAVGASLSKDRDQYLEELVLEWNASKKKRDISVSQRDVLDLLMPHKNLKSLTIKYYYDAGSFPDWIGDSSFSKISFLCLHNCEYCCRLPPLGQLPSLQELIIEAINGVVTVGSEFYGSTTSYNSSMKPFERLKVLKFKNMLKWEKWLPIGAENEDKGTGAFPQLEELYIKDSPNLRGELPLHLPSLAKLEIIECPNLEASASLPKAICGLLAGPPDHLANTGVKAAVVRNGKIERLRLGVRPKYFRLEVTNFHQESLEEMINPNSRLIQELSLNDYPLLRSLSRSGGLPSSLKELQIQNCGMLELPMHGQCSSLEALKLVNSCDSLVSFSLDVFPNLKRMSVDGCRNLESLTQHEGLEYLQIQNCGMLELPMHEQCSSLEALKLVNSCDSLVSFPLDLFPNLKRMSVDGCRNLVSLTQHEGLEDLVILNCPNFISFPKGGLGASNPIRIEGFDKQDHQQIQHHLIPSGGLTSTLKTLKIRGCKEFKLPMHLQYSSLKKFHLSDSYDSLVSFPLDLFPKLEEIRILGCGNLESLTVSEQSDQHHDLVQISTMVLGFCPKFVSFPKGGLCAPKLRLFWVDNCESLKSLPDKMYTLLTSLEDLLIEECREIESFPEEGLPSTLKVLKIYDCDKLIANRAGWGLQNLPLLEKLEICGKSEDVKSFPVVTGLLPTTLTELRIAGFPNMTSLDKKGLQGLTSLKNLWIYDCDKMMYMPQGGLPASLSFLLIRDCPLLEKQLERRKGKEWLKIAHVSRIEIGGEVVQNIANYPNELEQLILAYNQYNYYAHVIGDDGHDIDD